jgi:hypothetical protein
MKNLVVFLLIGISSNYEYINIYMHYDITIKLCTIKYP